MWTDISCAMKPVWEMTRVTGNEVASSLKLPVSSVTVPMDDPLIETETPAIAESVTLLFTLPVISCCACVHMQASANEMQNKLRFIIRILSGDMCFGMKEHGVVILMFPEYWV